MPHIFWLLSLILCAALAASAGERAPPPRLVLLVVVDQLPAPALSRRAKQLAPGGFRRLVEGGVVYTQAHYDHAATLTGVGHATIATGALAAEHGIAGNDWYDAESDRPVYCVEDREHRWVGGKEKDGEGASPRHLEAPTFGDEWLIETRKAARVVSISLKDRGSILLGGRLGKSFWYDERTGLFVSSTYYYPAGELPSWVASFNAATPAAQCFGSVWELLLPAAAYDAAPDDRDYEIEVKGLGRTFPHRLGQGLAGPGPELYKALLHAPHGNALIFDLARAALDGEELGRRGVTDVLCLSLTANDYCGHVFGPESLEYQDMTLRTDRMLEAFLADLDRRLGKGSYAVVLTSDHGATPTPEHIEGLGLPVGRIDPAGIAACADGELDAAFGAEDWTAKFLNPGLFLRSEPIRRRRLDPAEVERAAARAVERLAGVQAAFPRSDLAQGRCGDTLLSRAARATLHARRSPDVIIIQKPYWYLYKDAKQYDGMHGSPYAFDTHVPVVLYGCGAPPALIHRRVSPASIAPTVAALLGISPPAAAVSPVLVEVLPAAAGSGAGATQGHAAVELFALPSAEPLRSHDGTSVLAPITVEREGSEPLVSRRSAPAVEGGFSGLALVPGERLPPGTELEVWTISDRGPNLVIDKRRDRGGEVFGKGSKLFPFPAYTQNILRLQARSDGTVVIVERIRLSRRGLPLSGLPSSDPLRSSHEIAYSGIDEKGGASVVPSSPVGYDLEGLHVEYGAGGAPSALWTCDEYGPSLQVFDPQGRLVRELAPGATPAGAGTPDSPAIAPLPKVLRHRRANRGFEGLAGSSTHIFAMVQSTFDPEGGASGEPGHGNTETRLHRLVRVDKRTGDAVELAYDHVESPQAFGAVHADVKIGDIALIDDTGRELLAMEYAAGFYTHVCRLRVTTETTLLAGAAGVEYESGKRRYTPIERLVLLDLSETLRLLPVSDKPEGLAVMDSRTLLVSFDNDYGLGSDDEEIFELPHLRKVAILARLKLSAPEW